MTRNKIRSDNNDCAHRVGAVGFVSVLFPFLLPLGLVKVDEETREPVSLSI